jgi:hypothetical protein
MMAGAKSITRKTNPIKKSVIDLRSSFETSTDKLFHELHLCDCREERAIVTVET